MSLDNNALLNAGSGQNDMISGGWKNFSDAEAQIGEAGREDSKKIDSRKDGVRKDDIKKNQILEDNENTINARQSYSGHETHASMRYVKRGDLF